MTAYRIVWKSMAISATCIVSALVLALVRGVGLLVPWGRVRREDFVIRSWARIMTRIFGLRVSISGPLPERGTLLVSNHLSYMDVLVYMSQVDARLLSKAEVKQWPLLGPLARFGGTLFVDRARRKDLTRVLQEIRDTLDQGRGVVFFPEGTSGSGREVMAFKPSLFEVAAQGNLEVSTAALRYECPPAERAAHWSIAWWGSMPFLPHMLGILRLSRFDAHIVFNEQRLRGTDRKELAQEARSAIIGAFEPLYVELGEDELFTASGELR